MDNNININVSKDSEDKGSKYFEIFDSFYKGIVNSKWSNIVKFWVVAFIFLATILGGIFIYHEIKNGNASNAVTEKLIKDQNEENLRDFTITPKIQKELSILVYTLKADRAFLFEFHNGKKNASGLPFRFADMTYEEINEERKVDKIGIKFQNIPLTLYKYPHYLQQKKVMIGTLDEIRKIDPDYADQINDCGGKYLGMIYLNINGSPLGFLCVSYHDMDNIPSRQEIDTKLREYDKVITQLLDLNTQMTRHKANMINEE
jgi:hypothetical protein